MADMWPMLQKSYKGNSSDLGGWVVLSQSRHACLDFISKAYTDLHDPWFYICRYNNCFQIFLVFSFSNINPSLFRIFFKILPWGLSCTSEEYFVVELPEYLGQVYMTSISTYFGFSYKIFLSFIPWLSGSLLKSSGNFSYKKYSSL